MEKLTTHTGIGVPLRQSNVDTDQIIPAVYLKRITRTGFEANALEPDAPMPMYATQRQVFDTVLAAAMEDARGWTDRVVTPAQPPQVVNGLVTGWHDPDASHLLLLEAVAGAELVQRAYDHALAHDYLWHEFGDSALLMRR